MPYLNVNQVESALAAGAGPPNQLITQLITLPNLTWEGRTCRAIKIAGGSGPGRIGVYFIGGVHAREWGSPDILIFFIQQLTQAYRTNTGISLGGKSFAAAQIQSIVNSLDIFVFPQVNADGRNHSMNVDPMWRKNRRPAPPSNPTCPGVDINRNYDFLWNYPAHFHPSAPVQNSQNPCDYQVYVGPSAASEPETKNVVSMFDNHPNIRFFVDLHSYSELILYGWGDDQEQSTDPAMNFQNPAFDGQRGLRDDVAYREYISGDNEALSITLGNRMQDAIQAVRGRGYRVEQSFDLYPTAGTSTDYADSRHFVDSSKGEVFSFTIEWGRTFQPPYSEMENIIREVTAGLLEFCLEIVKLLESAIFVHRVTAQNISGTFPCTTYVDHPLTNANPNAILIVTHNWNPLGMPSNQGQFNNHPIGVWYDEGLQRWAIFNEDEAAMSEGVAFNVSVYSYPSL
jgi:carboxypeptidase T